MTPRLLQHFVQNNVQREERTPMADKLLDGFHTMLRTIHL